VIFSEKQTKDLCSGLKELIDYFPMLRGQLTLEHVKDMLAATVIDVVSERESEAHRRRVTEFAR
jgi:hypothetical protein